MAVPACSDEEFIHILETAESVDAAARQIGITLSNVFKRRRRIEERYGIGIRVQHGLNVPAVIEPITVNGPAVMFNDCHWWPKIYSDAYWIMLQVITEIKPVAIILNGDAFDGAQISRHPRIGWDVRPGVAEELAAVKDRLDMIRQVSGDADLYWNRGNHDMRFDTRLASVAAEFAGVEKMRLSDHFPHWKFQWGLNINDVCVVKHRYKGGAGAGRNNTLYAGLSMVTGHDHHLQVTRFSDYRGTRYGVQCGTLADPGGPQFADYLEGAPTDWQSGFVVGYFDGQDHAFDTVEVVNGSAWFGGRRWSV